VPRVFADEHRGPAPRRVEGAHVAATLDEALLVEQPVGRQKDLAMNVRDARLTRAQRHVHRAVVQLVVPDLVKPAGHVERARIGNGGAKRRVQLRGEGAGGDGIVAYRAFEEVAGKGALGQAKHRRPRFQAVDLGEHGAESREISRPITLSGLDLSDGEVNERSHITKLVRISS
jgi:hypothetical protein